VIKVAHLDPGDPDDGRYRPGYELVAEQLLQYIARENLRPGDRYRPSRGWPTFSARPAT
jgi:hypothetical protein